MKIKHFDINPKAIFGKNDQFSMIPGSITLSFSVPFEFFYLIVARLRCNFSFMTIKYLSD